MSGGGVDGARNWTLVHASRSPVAWVVLHQGPIQETPGHRDCSTESLDLAPGAHRVPNGEPHASENRQC
jgi:hypothetical protein